MSRILAKRDVGGGLGEEVDGVSELALLFWPELLLCLEGVLALLDFLAMVTKAVEING